ncbi:MAG: DUF2889 domain-containing protein [Desulfomonile sp.]|nr:DUF2889 domain-containing protein [Deltaproteobacteria bacterium]
MLAYARCKSVGVQKQGEHLRVVSGILEDELYAMECEMVVNRATLTIESVQTRMKRFTTKRCTRAQSVFLRAEGWRLGKDLDRRIKKELGREGCRHMAVLMVDCCRTLARAEVARELREAIEKDPGLDKKGFLAQFYEGNPELAEYLKLQ